jgi:CHAT domain-containing protein
LGHAEEALDYQKEALKVYHNLAEVWQSRVGETYGWMGDCYDQMQNYAKALEYYEKDLEVRFRTVGQTHPEVAYVYSNIGNVHRKAHRFPESLSAYQQALQVLFAPLNAQDIYQNPPVDQTLNPYILYEVLNGKAQAFREYAEYGSGTHDDLRFSLETYQLAANTLHETRKSLLAAASKNLLAEQSIQYFEDALETAWLLYEQTGEKEYIDQAFKLSEKSKSVALLEALKESEAREFAHIPSAVLAQERALKVDLAYYRRKLFEEQQIKPDSSGIRWYQNKIFALKNSYDSLISVMEEEFPDYYQLKYNTDVTSLMQVQQNMLKENQALLTYFMGDSSIYTFAINNKQAAFFKTKKDSTYEQNMDVVRTVIANKADDIDNFVASAYGMYHALIAPAEPLIREKDLIVITDGLLGYLPFEVLLTSPAEGAPSSFYNLPYLIKSYQITYAYSATLWHETLKPLQKKSPTRYLAFAPDFNQRNMSQPASPDPPSSLAFADMGRGVLAKLEGTAYEVSAIDNYFKGQFYEGATASEHVFKKNAPDYDIIHLATHAIIDDEHPMNSRLLFTMQPDSLEDGDLYAWELYNMQLNAQMTVLSACNTGFGKLQRGEGVMSLGRAFAYAGCPSVIMSLWPAQDQATAEIMVHFYQGLSEGMTKDESLRKAKLKYLGTTHELFAHPFYWASFVVQGDPGPLNIQNDNFSYGWLGGGMALLLLCLFLFFKYRK